MSAAAEFRWDVAGIAAIPPHYIVAALASNRDAPLPAAIMHAVAEELDLLVSAAADGAPPNADVLERLVARCRIAAELARRHLTPQGGPP